MRISTHGDSVNVSSLANSSNQSKVASKVSNVAKEETVQDTQNKQSLQGTTKDALSKEKLEEAVKSINEFFSTQTQHKSSKFEFHEGLDRYYVKLVDADTKELIKEIPPEKLLNAFYEMQKLAGMIVDEKI